MTIMEIAQLLKINKRFFNYLTYNKEYCIFSKIPYYSNKNMRYRYIVHVKIE